MLGRLHVIIDVRPRPNGDPLALARLALEGGAPVIQLRTKDLSDRDRYELAARMTDLCASFAAACIVNDRPDIAALVGAAGAHVGAHDLPVAAARQLLGPEAVVGARARDAATAQRHQAEGATYLGVGPAYATTTKDGLPPPLGPRGVAAVAAAVTIPVIAIAGVTADRVPDLLAAGAHGVAVVGSVAHAADPRLATKELVSALDGHL